MARDYWVEVLPCGQRRFAKKHPSLKRSYTHDGSQSSRGRRVDFVDVTREEYNSLLARESALREANEGLQRENGVLKADWRTCDDELRRLQSVVPSLENTVRNLEYENHELRRRSNDHYHRGSREGEDSLRKLRHKNTKLQNENETLLARLHSLERDIRDGASDRATRRKEDAQAWKRRYDRVEVLAERLQRKLDEADDWNRRLVLLNESLARQDRKVRRDCDTYMAILRRHGLMR